MTTEKPVLAKDYKALYERALKRQETLEKQVRTLTQQLANVKPAGFGRGKKNINW